MNNPSDRLTAPATTTDLELLRQFEPVVYYTKGEQFFPTDVDAYVRDCSLWEHSPDGGDELLIRQGELTLDKLVESRPAAFGTVRYLRFVETLSLAEAAQVLAECVTDVLGVYLEEFGSPEAIWALRVKGFPAVVTMDAHGNSLHAAVLEQSRERLKQLV